MGENPTDGSKVTPSRRTRLEKKQKEAQEGTSGHPEVQFGYNCLGIPNSVLGAQGTDQVPQTQFSVPKGS